MTWVLLWATLLIAFLVFFFRRAPRMFLIWVLGLAAIIAAALLQYAFLDGSPGYVRLVEGAARLGRGIVIVAALVLVADLAFLAIYAIRNWRTDDMQGTVVTENRALNISLNGLPLAGAGRSKLKILYSKSGFVTMDSLLDGTATRGERWMALGIVTLYASFFLVFVGAGLIMMKQLAIFVLFPIIPGLFVYKSFFGPVWKAYRESRRRIASRRRTSA